MTLTRCQWIMCHLFGLFQMWWRPPNWLETYVLVHVVLFSYSPDTFPLSFVLKGLLDKKMIKPGIKKGRTQTYLSFKAPSFIANRLREPNVRNITISSLKLCALAAIWASCWKSFFHSTGWFSFPSICLLANLKSQGYFFYIHYCYWPFMRILFEVDKSRHFRFQK